MIVANDKQYLFEKMKVPKAVMYLVIPTIISQLITIIYNWADIFFVGQLNDTFQMAAITICYPAFMMTTALSICLVLVVQVPYLELLAIIIMIKLKKYLR